MAYRKKDIEYEKNRSTPPTPPMTREFCKIDPYWPILLEEDTKPFGVSVFTYEEVPREDLEVVLNNKVKCRVYAVYWLPNKYVIVLEERIEYKDLVPIIKEAVKAVTTV